MKRISKKNSNSKRLIVTIISVAVILLVACLIFILLGKRDSKIPEKPKMKDVVSNIELGKEQYIEQLKKVPINGTDDYFMITEKRVWKVPEHEEGTTVSFVIYIPYVLHVDGVDYNGMYSLNMYNQNRDDNPKYTFSIENLTSVGDISVLFKNK